MIRLRQIENYIEERLGQWCWWDFNRRNWDTHYDGIMLARLDACLWYWQVAEPLTWTDIEKNFAEKPGRE